MVWEEMSFEEFQDGRRGGHLVYQKVTVLAILNLCDASHKVLVQSDIFWEKMSFEEIQDGRHGGHLGHRNRTILAMLNLCVTVMPPIKINPTYGWGGDVI